MRQVIDREPNLAQARLLLADAYREQNKPGEALAIYQEMEKKSPQNPGVPMLEGFVYGQQRDNVSARRAFSRALDLAPGDLRALDALLQLDLAEKQYEPAVQMLEKAMTNNAEKYQLYLMEAKVFEAQGDAVQTVAALESAIKINPDLASAHLVLAQHYVKQQPQKALDELQLALQKDPASSSGWMLKGQVLNEAKDYPGAADAYQRMLALDPQSSVALNNLAYLYSEFLGQPEKAYEMAKKARELLPFDASTADTLGWVLFHRRDFGPALGYLSESVRKMPQSADVQYHFGKVNYMLGQEAAATTAFQAALRLDPTFEGHAECQRCLDLLAIDPAHITDAERTTLEKRVAESPDDPVALARLAVVYKQAGDNERAVAVDEAILKENPNNVNTMLDLARLYSLTNASRAFAMAKSAYSAAPQNPDAAYLLGKLAYQVGNFKWALSLLKAAVEARADDANVQFDLAQAAYGMGKVSDARASFQKALSLGLDPGPATQAKQWLDLMTAVEQPALAAATGPASQSILKSDPENVPALMVSAVVAEQQSQWDAAAQAYQKVLDHFPDFTPARKKLALIYVRNPQRINEAYALATKAREASPDDPDLTRLLGIIFFRQGDYRQAVNYLNQSVSAQPDDAEICYDLGLTQYHLKNMAESRTSLRLALKMNLPSDWAVEARRILAEIK